MKKRLKCSIKFKPTREEIENYVYRNGIDSNYVDDFLNPGEVDYPQQFWEAVRRDIDIPDFDRWRYFQHVIGHKLEFDVFKQISKIFDEHDIEILNMPSDSESIW